MASAIASTGGNAVIDALAPEQPSTDGSHRPTVEEVVDEEDVLHPPPSAHLQTSSVSNDGSSGPTPVLSEKAAGKQKASDESEVDAPPKPAPKLDVSSEEAFPSLGAPKGKAPSSASAWSKKPAVGSTAINGAVNGKAPTNGPTSRPSAPVSSMFAPAMTSTAQRGAAQGPPGLSLPGVNLPGRHTDSIHFAPSELKPPNQLKGSRQEFLREINRKSKAKVEMKQGQMGNTVVFVGTGPQDAVREALREVASKLGSTVRLRLYPNLMHA